MQPASDGRIKAICTPIKEKIIIYIDWSKCEKRTTRQDGLLFFHFKLPHYMSSFTHSYTDGRNHARGHLPIYSFIRMYSPPAQQFEVKGLVQGHINLD